MPASILYPPHGNFSVVNSDMPINFLDFLFIQYMSTYDNIDLTLSCTSLNTSYPDGSQVTSVRGLPGNGTFRSGSLLDQTWLITQSLRPVNTDWYPCSCQYQLSESNVVNIIINTVAVKGENFTAIADRVKLPATFSPTPSASIDTITEKNVGLSSGAKIGIGVGVSVPILLIVGVVLILIRSRRKRRATRNIPPEARGDVDATITDKPELAGSVPRPTTKKVEMAADSLQELHGDEQHPVHELAG